MTTKKPKEDTAVDRLMVRYGDRPIIRALLQLIPCGLGSASDVMLYGRVQQIKEDRARRFFDTLNEGKIELTEELIESEDFLHCFFATTNAALNTRRREKIELFAKLLRSNFSKERPQSVDEYEEFLSTLDDLSFTEWRALLILDRFSDTPRDSGDNTLTWSGKFWPDFTAVIEAELNVPRDEITPFLNRIARTGLYEQIVGTYFNYSGGVGYLTPRFHRLKSFVLATE